MAIGPSPAAGITPLTDYLNFPPLFYKHGRIDKNYHTTSSVVRYS